MPLLADVEIKRAVENVAAWGDTDVFPFPVENHVLHDRQSEVIAVLKDLATSFEDRIQSEPVVSYSTLSPVGYTGFRWATQIDPMWNAYLLALVLSLAPDIESARVPQAEGRVFSYRFQADPAASLFAPSGWRDFQQRTRELANEHKYVVSVDIADFYSRIYHHRLENALRPLDVGANKSRQIMAILGRLSNGTSYGLPVGGPAARLLAELLLDRVDHLLMAEPSVSQFCRYADDYRFFVNDLPDAYRAIGFLSEKLLRNEGLTLQKTKTRVMSSAEYLSMLDPVSPPPGSAARFLSLHIHFDPYSATATDDYELLRSQLGQFDVLGLLRAELTKSRVHGALTRRLVSAIKFMDPQPRDQAVLSLLENVDTLTPVMPQALWAIRDCFDDLAPEVKTTVHNRVRELIDNRHPVAQVDLNLAYMLRVLARQHSTENEMLLIRLFTSPHGFASGPVPYIQRDILLTLARWNVTYWLSDRKNYYSSMHPWVQRAFLIASYSLGDEGDHWRRAVRQSLSPFDLQVRDWVAAKRSDAGWQVPV